MTVARKSAARTLRTGDEDFDIVYCELCEQLQLASSLLQDGVSSAVEGLKSLLTRILQLHCPCLEPSAHL